MSNMFDKAKSAEPKKAKSKKSKGREVAMPNLTTLASIKSVLAALEGMAKTTEAQIKEQMAQEFVKEGCAIKRRPENFKGIDEGSSASCQIRKRSSRSVLTPDEIAFLEEHDISYETLEDVPETYIINPEHAKDGKLLEKISKALGKVPGLPEDFIQHQAPKSRNVASEEGIEQIFALEPGVTYELLEIVAALAIRPKLEEEDLTGALKQIMKTIG